LLGYGLDSSGLGEGLIVVCENGDESPGSMKRREFLEQLCDY